MEKFWMKFGLPFSALMLFIGVSLTWWFMQRQIDSLHEEIRVLKIDAKYDSLMASMHPLEEKKEEIENNTQENAPWYADQEKEWIQLRNHEEKNLGKSVTFEILVQTIFLQCFCAPKKIIQIVDENGHDVDLRSYPKIHVKDWIVVTGIFKGINPDGEVLLYPTKIKNKGMDSR